MYLTPTSTYLQTNENRVISYSLFYKVAGMESIIVTTRFISAAGIGRVVMATIGKFGITASFSIIYIYTAELYPTPLR